MLDRLDPRRVLRGVLGGLRHRSRDKEPPDIGARLVLFGLPALVAGALISTRSVIDEPELVLAAAALLVGALLAGFSQIAGWRERILERGRKVDGVRVRALNEAGALILMSVHVSVLASGAVFAVALITRPVMSTWHHWVVVVLSSIGPAALTYVALSLVFVANSLWDGFTNEQSDIRRSQLGEFDEESE